MSFSDELITVLDYLAHKLGIVIDWTSDSVMPYLEDLCARFIEYEIFNSFITVGAWALVLIMFIGFLIPTHHIARTKYEWDFDYFPCWAAAVLWIGFVVCVIGLLASVISESFHILECYKMPEKVIIEYIQGILENQPK